MKQTQKHGAYNPLIEISTWQKAPVFYKSFGSFMFLYVCKNQRKNSGCKPEKLAADQFGARSAFYLCLVNFPEGDPSWK